MTKTQAFLRVGIAVLISINMLIGSFSPSDAAQPAVSASPVETGHEVVLWNKVYQDGKTYYIYVVLNEGISDPSLASGRPLEFPSDRNIIAWIYVTENDNLIPQDHAKELVILAQKIASLNSLGSDRRSADYYLPSYFVSCSDHDPITYPLYHVQISFIPYYLCLPAFHQEYHYEKYIFFGDGRGMDDFKFHSRNKILADLLLDAILQPELNSQKANQAFLRYTLYRILDQDDLPKPLVDLINKKVDSISAVELLSSLTTLSVKTKDILEVSKLLGIINALGETPIVIQLGGLHFVKFSLDAVEYMLKVALADQLAGERLESLKTFINLNIGKIDQGWIHGINLAESEYIRQKNLTFDLENGFILKGIESYLESHPGEALITLGGIVSSVSTVILAKIGAVTLSQSLGFISLLILTQVEAAQLNFDFKLDVEKTALAPTLQRLLFSQARTNKTLFEIASDAKSSNGINGVLAGQAIHLYQINHYLAWKYLNIESRVPYDSRFIDDYSVSSSIYYPYQLEWTFTTREQYRQHLDSLTYTREYSKIKLQSATSLLVSSLGENNLSQLVFQAQPTDGFSSRITFVEPHFPGKIVYGEYTIDVNVLSSQNVAGVKFTIKDSANEVINTSYDYSYPYQCTIETDSWSAGRYKIEAQSLSTVVGIPANIGLSMLDSQDIYDTTWIQVPPAFDNDVPSIELISPKNHVANDHFKIEWDDNDIDDNATISLYYDNNNNGFDGTQITGYLQEDWSSNYYNWHIPPDLADGQYWIYAEIDDGVNLVQRAYSPGPLQIQRPVERDSFTYQNGALFEEIGDGDGVLDVGESFSYEIEIGNTTSQNWYEVKAYLIPDTGGMFIEDDDVKFSNFGSNETHKSNGDFNFSAPLGSSTSLPFKIKIVYRDIGGVSFYDLETVTLELQENDTQEPIITWGPMVENIQPDSALVSWGTDEPASSVVLYGPTTSYGMVADNGVISTTHRIPIRGLAPGLLHYFKVQSKDQSGNGPVEAVGSVTTTNVGSGIHVTEADYPKQFTIFGLAWDNNRSALWILHCNDTLQSFISRYDPASDTVQVIFPVNFMTQMNNSARGLAFDGTFLWMADASDELIYKINPDTGDALNSYPWPGDEPRGLAWDGVHIWVADSSMLQICQTNTALQPVSCFPSPGTLPMDLAWDGSALWNVDANTRLLYRISTGGERLRTVRLSGRLGRGLTYSNGDLWISLDSDRDDFLIRTNVQDDTTSPIMQDTPVATAENGTSVIITWQTDEPAASLVQQYDGSCSGTGTLLGSNSYLSSNHRVVVSQLTPGATLQYCVGSQDFANNLITWAGPYLVTTPSTTNLNIVDTVWGYDDGDSGMTFEGSEMWTTDTRILYKVDPATGKQLSYLYLPTTVDSEGLAWDGSGLWYYDDDASPAPKLIKINSSTGSQISSIPAPDTAIKSLAWDGSYLWAVDSSSDTVYRVNPSNGAVVSSFTSTLTYLHGIAIDSAHSQLWLYDQATNMIAKSDYSGNILGTYPAYGSYIRGLVWKDGYLWVHDKEWRYKIDVGSTDAPVIAKVTTGDISFGIFRIGQTVAIDVYEQFGRAGFSGTVSITSATDDPGINNAPLVDLGGGRYQYLWNTTGRLGATDYQVEAGLTDGVRSDSDGLEGSDLTLMLAPRLSGQQQTVVLGATTIKGVSWASENLWTTDDGLYPGKIYQVDWNTGSILSMCTAAMAPVYPNESDPQGITWDGTQLWVANFFYNRNLELTRHTTNCAISARIPYAGDQPSGIAWDGTYLWVSDLRFDLIFKMNTSGAILARIPSPVPYPLGLAWENGNLWVADNYNGLYQIDPGTGSILAVYALDTQPRNLTWSGDNFYITTTENAVRKMTTLSDLAVAPLTVSDINIDEGLSTTITATVYAYGQGASNVQLGWYLGDPASGGIEIQAPESLGTVSPGNPVISQLSWSELTAGIYTICTKVDPLDNHIEVDEANNTVCVQINVVDTDVDPPVVNGLTLSAPYGDGDPYLEDDEQVLFTWQAQDASGIGNAKVVVDGLEYVASEIAPGNLSAVTGPFSAGQHICALYTTDADNTPETTIIDCPFSISVANPNVTSVYPAPNADGVDVNVEMSAAFQVEMRPELSQDDVIIFELRDSENMPLFGSLNLGRSNEEMTFIPADVLNPNQVYTMTIFASNMMVDELGNLLAGDYSWVFATEADTQAPEVQMLYPQPNDVVTGYVDFSGLVYDASLKYYRVEIGLGTAPTSWNLLREDYANVINNSLGFWNAINQPDGDYTLRIIAEDLAGNNTMVTIPVVVNNPIILPEISSVSPRWIGVNYDNITIDVWGSNFLEGAGVTFGDVPSPEVIWVHDQLLKAKVPPGLGVGSYQIKVDNGDGKIGIWSSLFWVLNIQFLPLIIR